MKKTNLLQHGIDAIHHLVTGAAAVSGTMAFNNGDTPTSIFAFIVLAFNMALQWAHAHQGTKAAAEIEGLNSMVQQLSKSAIMTSTNSGGTVVNIPSLNVPSVHLPFVSGLQQAFSPIQEQVVPKPVENNPVPNVPPATPTVKP